MHKLMKNVGQIGAETLKCKTIEIISRKILKMLSIFLFEAFQCSITTAYSN